MKGNTTQITSWVCTTIVALAGIYFTDSVYCLTVMVVPGLLSIIHDFICGGGKGATIEEASINLDEVMGDMISESVKTNGRTASLSIIDNNVTLTSMPDK